MSQLIDELERFSLASTQGEWYACTWDSMERPHISPINGPHHNASDIAQNLKIGDAIYITELKNAAPRLLEVVRAAEMVVASGESPLTTPLSPSQRLVAAVEALYDH